MSRNENIDNAIWDDPDFAALSPNATLLYLWSWTNPRCGMAGIYKVGQRAMLESKVPPEAISATLEELSGARFAFYEDSVLWVRSRVKHLRSRSSTMAVSVAKDVDKLSAAHPLRASFLREYGIDPWLRDELADALAGTHRGPIEDPSQNPVGKGKSDTPSGTPPGVPMTGEGTGSSSSKAEELPEDFPRELEPHLEAVDRILVALAARHGAKAVSRLSLASVLMARPRKPLVRCAHDCAAHWDGRQTRLKDVVAAYRNWLDRADDLARVEMLPGEGSSGGVVSINPAVARRNAWKNAPEYEGRAG